MMIHKPEEISQLVMFPISDHFSYVTGAAFVLDGGMLRALRKRT